LIVATVRECETAFEVLAHRLSGVDEETQRKASFDRTLTCTISDLGVIFSAHLIDGELRDIQQTESADAQLRLTVSSDDLVALTDGSLGAAKAWASGRLRIDASVFDLLKLRSLF
jgi:putative sterol carrier protein